MEVIGGQRVEEICYAAKMSPVDLCFGYRVVRTMKALIMSVPTRHYRGSMICRYGTEMVRNQAIKPCSVILTKSRYAYGRNFHAWRIMNSVDAGAVFI